jgi:hypothetical protein
VVSAARDDRVGIVLAADDTGEGNVFVVAIGGRDVVVVSCGVLGKLVELPPLKVYKGTKPSIRGIE